jgi:mRNA interferase HigB
MGTWNVRVLGVAVLTKFATKHAATRKALQRFLVIAQSADWPHFPAVKESFSRADYAPISGTIVFDIGGNKYRLVAQVDFQEQLLSIQKVMTHEQYDREKL